jgi:hypothetical protein
MLDLINTHVPVNSVGASGFLYALFNLLSTKETNIDYQIAIKQ